MKIFRLIWLWNSFWVGGNNTVIRDWRDGSLAKSMCILQRTQSSAPTRCLTNASNSSSRDLMHSHSSHLAGTACMWYRHTYARKTTINIKKNKSYSFRSNALNRVNKKLKFNLPETLSRTSDNVVETGKWRVRNLWPAPYIGCWMTWLVALILPLYSWGKN